MPWRNNGRQANVTWRLGRNPATVCHYGNRWRDAYSMFVRQRAVETVLRRVAVESAVDVGAGSGLWVATLARHARTVVPLDLAMFGMVPGLVLADMEKLPFAARAFDLVSAMTALAHVEDQPAALDELTRISSRYCLFVEFLAEPTPLYVRNIAHRDVFTATGLDRQMGRRGFAAVKRAGCGLVDGALFVRTARWLWPIVAMVTCALDLASGALLAARCSKYQAVLYERAA